MDIILTFIRLMNREIGQLSSDMMRSTRINDPGSMSKRGYDCAVGWRSIRSKLGKQFEVALGMMPSFITVLIDNWVGSGNGGGRRFELGGRGYRIRKETRVRWVRRLFRLAEVGECLAIWAVGGVGSERCFSLCKRKVSWSMIFSKSSSNGTTESRVRIVVISSL